MDMIYSAAFAGDFFRLNSALMLAQLQGLKTQIAALRLQTQVQEVKEQIAATNS